MQLREDSFVRDAVICHRRVRFTFRERQTQPVFCETYGKSERWEHTDQRDTFKQIYPLVRNPYVTLTKHSSLSVTSEISHLPNKASGSGREQKKKREREREEEKKMFNTL